eukprot:6179108-Pleurochrysis_carterae.AAC.1
MVASGSRESCTWPVERRRRDGGPDVEAVDCVMVSGCAADGDKVAAAALVDAEVIEYLPQLEVQACMALALRREGRLVRDSGRALVTTQGVVDGYDMLDIAQGQSHTFTLAAARQIQQELAQHSNFVQQDLSAGCTARRTFGGRATREV